MKFAWQVKYTEALMELDREALPERIAAAEKDIYRRVEELRPAADASAEELWAIHDALRGLKMLAKIECPPHDSADAGARQVAHQREIAS